MAYAICEAFGRQIKVKPGDEVFLEAPQGTNGNLILDKVLLVSEDKGISIGRPYLNERRVELSFLRSAKGEKLVAFKFRRRKHSKSKIGYRSKLSVFRVKGI